MKYILLSDEFYKTYNEEDYPEILHKPSRPYIMLVVKIDNLTFAIPIRSHIRHNYGFITNKNLRTGLDFTKAIIILNPQYVAKKERITITKEEMLLISNNRDLIIKDFKTFLNTYKRKIRNNLTANFLQYCTLQYFHKELGLE